MSQTTEPVTVVKEPGLHWMQAVAEVLGIKEPVLHSVQVEVARLLVKRPGGQFAQLTWPLRRA